MTILLKDSVSKTQTVTVSKTQTVTVSKNSNIVKHERLKRTLGNLFCFKGI
jgi:hypothetical protein